MAVEQRTTVRQGDTVRQTSADYSTEQQEQIVQTMLDNWADGWSIQDIADSVGCHNSTARATINSYFEPVEAGSTAGEQAVIPLDDMEAEPESEADEQADMDDVDESRVALLADWFGLTESAARSLALAELQGDLDIGQPEHRAEADERPEPVTPEAPSFGRAQDAEVTHAIPDESDAPSTADELAAYRLGFKDGFVLARSLEE